MRLPKPTKQVSEILYELIRSKSPLSFHQLAYRTGVINLGQRISDLRREGLNVPCINKTTKNKHGRDVSYGTWTVQDQKEKAIEVYIKINGKKPPKVTDAIPDKKVKEVVIEEPKYKQPTVFDIDKK